MPDGHNHTYRKWTPEEDQIVIRERERNTKYADIANILGRTRNSIKGRVTLLRRNGEPMEELPQDPSLCYMSRGEIASSYRQAKNQKEQKRILSQLCCMSIAEITQILEEEGALQTAEKRKPKETRKIGNKSAYRTRQRYTEDEDAAILKAYLDGRTASDIGKQFGRSTACIHARIVVFRRRGILEKNPPGHDPDGKKKGNENIVIVSQK